MTRMRPCCAIITAMDDEQLEQVRAASRDMWATGHYPTVAERLRPVADLLVARAGIGPGDRVLDVGTGSGSVAVAAARRGAEVTGVDHIDTWFPDAHRLAADAGVTLALDVGDAEELPYPDAAFDVVVSNFALVFAPRHEVAAGEVARVCRPGGTVAFTAWADDGRQTRAFAIIARELGSDYRPGGSPEQWGRPDHTIATFAAHGVDLTLERGVLHSQFASEDDLAEFLLTASGPYIKARQSLEATGRWDEVWARVRAANRDANVATDGTYATEQHYLVAIGTRSF